MEQAQKYDFLTFLKNYVPDYKIDEYNRKVLNELTLYLARSPKFEQIEPGYSLDKGILLVGPVGTGKTYLFHLIHSYQQYLGNNYTFKRYVVWRIAESFQSKGYACLNGHDKHNIYYDELALKDEATGFVKYEMVQHFGNKILMGEKIILMRYDVFKEYGYQTHLSSNESFDSLKTIYGTRAYSRLQEMCNFMILPGQDRRPTIKPTFARNMNNPSPPKAVELTYAEVLENQQRINGHYQEYVKSGTMYDNAVFDYASMHYYGIEIATELELMEIGKEKFQERKDYYNSLTAEVLKHNPQSRRLLSEYNRDIVSDDERTHLWNMTRTEAMKRYFDKLKSMNADNIPFPPLMRK